MCNFFTNPLFTFIKHYNFKIFSLDLERKFVEFYSRGVKRDRSLYRKKNEKAKMASQCVLMMLACTYIDVGARNNITLTLIESLRATEINYFWNMISFESLCDLRLTTNDVRWRFPGKSSSWASCELSETFSADRDLILHLIINRKTHHNWNRKHDCFHL